MQWVFGNVHAEFTNVFGDVEQIPVDEALYGNGLVENDGRQMLNPAWNNVN